MKRYIHKETGEYLIARDDIQAAAIERQEGFAFVDEVTQEELDKKKK